MKAADCLREPGDVARRESDGAVAVNYKGGFMLNYASGMVESLAMPETIPGDDWQPLHPAGDHAAEVKRLTAERDDLRDAYWSESRRNAALTARVAELESGSAFVGEELRSRPERDEHYGFYWAQSSRGGPELELSHTDEASIPECHDWMRAFAYTGPTTAPLPTAGDEACEVNPIVSRMCEHGTKCCTVEHAPAEPDSKEIESATPDKRAAALHRQGRGVRGDLLRPVHGLADEGEEVNTRPTDGMSDETVGRILDMVLDDSQCNAYKLPLGTQVVIGKRRWRLVERDAGHPDHMRFGETTTGESYPETGRVMYPSEVQWCIDQGCEVIPPAEPDSPAEERPSKLRDESWIREAADAEDQHASVCAGDMAPRKPDCLDGVPAVLCEDDNGDSVWAFGPIDVCGEIAAVWMQGGEHTTVFLTDVANLTPIHHDPTDAAAVELAGRIERGGSNG